MQQSINYLQKLPMSKDLIKFYKENQIDMPCHDKPQSRIKTNTVAAEVVETPPVLAKPAIKLNSKPDVVQVARKLADQCKTIEDLRQAIMDFNECELKKTAINTVIADGSVNSEAMFIGEAPGRHEDEQGIPFCGQSGKLLDNIIKAFGYQRADSYITNTVFWRPPGNRRPTPEEIAICRPFVEKHIELIAPKYIILVGSTAVESLLGSAMPMREVKQKLLKYNNKYLDAPISTFVIFHPSYLLRQPLKKKEMWSDIQFILNSAAK